MPTDHKVPISGIQHYYGDGVLHTDSDHSHFKRGIHKRKMINPIGSTPTGVISGNIVDFHIRPSDIRGSIDEVRILLNITGVGGVARTPTPLSLCFSTIQIYLTESEAPISTITGRQLDYMYFTFNEQKSLDRLKNTTGHYQNTYNSESYTQPVWDSGSQLLAGTSRFLQFPLQHTLLTKLPIAHMKSDIRVRFTFVPSTLMSQTSIDALTINFATTVPPFQLMLMYDEDTHRHSTMADALQKPISIPFMNCRRVAVNQTFTLNQDVDIPIEISPKGKCQFIFWNCIAIPNFSDNTQLLYNTPFEIDRLGSTDLNTMLDFTNSSGNSLIGGPINMRSLQYQTAHLFPNNTFVLEVSAPFESSAFWPIVFCSDPEASVNGSDTGHFVFNERCYLKITGNNSLAAAAVTMEFYFFEHKELLFNLYNDQVKIVD